MSGMYWSTHPFSKKLRKEAESRVIRFAEEMSNKAKNSSDPEVQAAWARWDEARRTLAMLESIAEEERKRENDE
jgi:hypothetical protein